MRVRRKSFASAKANPQQPVRKAKTRALRNPRLVLDPAASMPPAPRVAPQPITEKLLTIHEVAALLGINWKTVYRNLVKKHEIPVYAIGRSKRYNRQDIENALRLSAGVR